MGETSQATWPHVTSVNILALEITSVCGCHRKVFSNNLFIFLFICLLFELIPEKE